MVCLELGQRLVCCFVGCRGWLWERDGEWVGVMVMLER